VSGTAGFIGSSLVEALLRLDQRVIGLDNFATGKKRNLEEVRDRVSVSQWKRFKFTDGDIADAKICRRVCAGADVVLHHAALVSVPLSLAEPVACHQINVTGFLNMLVAARDRGVKRFVFASSSAVYGDDPVLPKVESQLGRPLSPYAATKAMNETYAELFSRAYGLSCIGLRYFNVFGPRQDPEGGYAAVIPRWIAAWLRREPVIIYGDGETSRDFCFIEDVVQANLLAATTTDVRALNRIYNIARGQRTTLNELFQLLQRLLRKRIPSLPARKAIHRAFRPGDVRHSLADITLARRRIGYAPAYDVEEGLELAMEWYRRNVARGR
jgi:UDP-N-acetylglucosamine 4-epimerase